MVSRELTIINRLGLHARAAAKFVTLASEFECEISVRNRDKSADAKSIMSVMMLAASKGAVIEIVAQGVDAEQAVTAIEALIQDRFGETE